MSVRGLHERCGAADMAESTEVWLPAPFNAASQARGDARVGGVAALRWGSPAAAKKMLAVHGRLDNAASFSFVGPLFAAAGYELVAIDLPGHGHSPWKPDGVYSLLSQAASVAQALDALGWSSCTMLAHSLGCSYATVAVGALPGRFGACVFIEGFAGFGLSFAVDFGMKSQDADERRVTAEPLRLRKSLANGTHLCRRTHTLPVAAPGITLARVCPPPPPPLSLCVRVPQDLLRWPSSEAASPRSTRRFRPQSTREPAAPSRWRNSAPRP